MNASSSVVSSASCSRDLLEHADLHARPDGDRAAVGRSGDRGAGAAGSTCRCRCGPSTPTRSPAPIVSEIGPSRNDPTVAVASSKRATIAPLRAASPNVNRSCHASRGSSTTSRRSIAFSVRAALPGELFALVDPVRLDVLVLLVGVLLGLVESLRGPLALALGAAEQVALLVGVLVVALAGMLRRRARARRGTHPTRPRTARAGG